MLDYSPSSGFGSNTVLDISHHVVKGFGSNLLTRLIHWNYVDSSS
jgi:hypothetical protein